MLSMLKKMKSNQTPDAPESNAGDDFHILWGVRKSLELLNIDSFGLKAVTIEGINSKESRIIDPTGSKLLGIDIAEYFGGENFLTAQSIIFSQLKYSTRNANSNWTINSISKANKKKGDAFSGSIIHRLASIYITHANEHGKEITNKKIKLRLISNRNVAREIGTLIHDIQVFHSSKNTLSFNKFKASLPTHASNIELLKNASKLEDEDFVDFLLLLDFSLCGTDSRFGQKQKAIEAIEAIIEVSGIEDRKLVELKNLIWDKMMPENRNRNLITNKDVLHVFGFGRVEDLLPTPSKIEDCPNYIDRNSFEDLKNIILNDHKDKFYLHAGAGYGKSTFVTHLTKCLPQDSISILFDCYGGGAYSDPSDKRHKHEWGILQIANELGLKVGSPFLLMHNGANERYLRELKSRLSQSVSILKRQNPNAILLLIVDAADNSITAANEQGEKSFIEDLIQEKLPDGCKLLITTRTGRLELFNFSTDFVPLQIDPFTIDETTAYLRSIRPEVTTDFIYSFHHLTNGVPRVQSYALQTKHKALDDILSPLRPNGKTINDIFDDQINVSSRRLGSKDEADTILKFLVNLPRPVPLSTITHIININPNIVTDFITDLHPGLILLNEQIFFKDEDFETYLKDSYPINISDFKQIANLMLQTANVDEYSCIHLAKYLLKSDNGDRLQKIVLEKTHISAITEPLQQKQVLIERTRLAMQSASSATDNATFIRLQLLAAETAKTDAVLRSILINNADLVTLYGLSGNNKEDYTFERSWYGSYYAMKAAALSRKPQYQAQAKEYLKEANSWFRWCLSLKEDDHSNRDFRININDITNVSEAILNTDGIEATIKYLKSWKPRKSVFESIKQLIYSLLDQKRTNVIVDLLNLKNIRIDIKLLLIQCLSEYGYLTNQKIVDEITLILLKFNGVIKLRLKVSIVWFCELLVSEKYSSQVIMSILAKLGDYSQKHLPHFYEAEFNKEGVVLFDLACRIQSLTANFADIELSVERFIPADIIEKLASKEYKERNSAEETKREYSRLYGFVLPYYKLRVEIYSQLFSQENIISTFDSIIEKVKGNWELRHYSHDVFWLFNYISSRFLDVIHLVDDKEHILSKFHDTFLKNEKSKKTDILINTANRISKINNISVEKLVLKYINQADEIICNDLLTLDDINNHYIKATRALNRVSPTLGEYFFTKAIEAVNQIDDNAYDQIRAINTLSKIGLPNPSPELAFEFGKYAEYTSVILSDSDNFPFSAAFSAIANIDPTSALAFLCRWDHRNVIEIDSYALKVFEKLAKLNVIDGVYLASLWPLSPYFQFDTPFLEFVEQNFVEFTQKNLVIEKNKYASQLLKDIKLRAHINWITSNCKKLLDIYQKNEISKEIIADLQDYLNKIEIFIPTEPSSTIQPIENKPYDWESFCKNIDVLKTEDLETALQTIRDEEDRINVFLHDNFLIYIGLKCSIKNQVSYFAAICNISPEILRRYEFKTIVEQLIAEWSYNPLLKKWIKENSYKVFKLYFSHYIKENDHPSYHIKSLAKSFGITNLELSPILIQLLPDFVADLNSTDLYELLTITSLGLTKKQNKEIIEETLRKWNSPIKNDFGDGQFISEIIPTTNTDEAISNVIRYMLGHPNRQIRWQAAHALRRLVNYSNNSTVLRWLIKNQDNTNCTSFQNNEFTFFWLSSKLHLWMTMNRIAHEAPSKLIQFIPEITKEACDPTSSHLLIKLFVKRTCSTLCKTGLIPDSMSLLQEIEKPFLNETSGAQSEILVDNDNWNFDFDHMDTISYWYDHLGDFFGLSGLQIATLAQEIICNKWGFTGDVTAKNHVHTADRDWHLIRNDHGNVPQIEILQTYYEYHAMFCVASKVLKTHKLEDKDYRTFEEWLNSYATKWEANWLADFRDPEPLLPIMHSMDNNAKNWLTAIDQQEYKDYIGLIGSDYVIVNSSFSKYHWKDYEHISIQSAFVSKDKAQALIRTLNTVENYHWYGIPSSEESEHSYHEDGFIFKGFLDKIEPKEGEMDKRDMFANNIAEFARIPGKIIVEHKSLTLSEDFRFSFMPNSIKPITVFENWSELKEHDSTDDRSGGYHLMIDKNYILEILQKFNFCLLIECEINRSKNDTYSKEQDGYSDFVALYLLYPNGTIESTSGDIRVR